MRTARGGVPISDGLAHLDYKPWRGDSIEAAINSETWLTPSGTYYKTSDDPGIREAWDILTPGTSVDFQFLIIGHIVDICNGNVTRSTATIYADAAGIFYNGLTVTPLPLRSQ
jgi:hypothetical protein